MLGLLFLLYILIKISGAVVKVTLPSLSFRSRPKIDLGVCASVVSSPWGPTSMWCILESKRAALLAVVSVDFLKNKCNFPQTSAGTKGTVGLLTADHDTSHYNYSDFTVKRGNKTVAGSHKVP